MIKVILPGSHTNLKHILTILCSLNINNMEIDRTTRRNTQTDNYNGRPEHTFLSN